jgi:urease accessory protein
MSTAPDSKVLSFLSLLQMTDSALPIGSYSHSWGLETFVQEGAIKNATEAADAVSNLLRFTLAPREGVAATLAYRYEKSPNRVNNRNSLATINNYLSASNWVEETHTASLKMGERLLRLAESLNWCDEVDLNAFKCAKNSDHTETVSIEKKYACHHSVAVGFIGAKLNIDIGELIPAYLFASTTALVAALVKLVPLGHTDGQRILSGSQPLIAELSGNCLKSNLDDLGGYAPLTEWGTQAHQTLYSRLFQS